MLIAKRFWRRLLNMATIQGHRNPIPTTDIIIEYSDGVKNGIVLITRKNPPYGIAIPGGFAEIGISLEDNARKEALEETGLEVILESPEKPLCVHSNPDRDPRFHILSVAYVGKGEGMLQAGDDAAGAQLYSIPEVKRLIKEKKLAFDHGRILEKYLEHRGISLYENLGKVGVIGRFKPLHLGGAVLLETLCASADHVVIGIGSANMRDERNPFTAEESKGMIDAYLSPRFSNYECVMVDQFGHLPQYNNGKKWTEEMIAKFGTLDAFVTGNEYVRDLLVSHYSILEAYTLIPEEKRVPLSATDVRIEMARGGDWQRLVPKEVSDYITEHGLVERFRREYGLATLAKLADSYHSPHGAREERAAVTGV